MNAEGELIPTRQSLLERLKDCDDHESWKLFFETYWRLIYTAAIKAGLNEAEAQDVVQETIISISKNMPTFNYKTEHGSFKAWLLNCTRWRIADQLKKRRPQMDEPKKSAPDRSTKTGTLEGLPDPAGSEFEAIWDQEWKLNIMDAALRRIKPKVDPKMYQVFDLYVRKEWSLSRVSNALKVNVPYIYVAKHRVSKLLKKELEVLKNKFI